MNHLANIGRAILGIGNQKSMETWTRESVRPQDPTMMPRVGKYRARLLVSAFRGPIQQCVMLNARVCAAQRIRLYKKGKAPNGRKVVDPSILSQLKGYGTYKANHKAMELLGYGEVSEITDHPVLTMIRKANPYQTGYEFAVQKYMYEDLAGDFGAHITPDTDTGEMCMFPLAPQWTEVVPDREGFVGKYRYGADEANTHDIDKAEVVFYKPLSNPFDIYRGSCWVSGLFKENVLHENSVDAVAYLMKNQLTPSMIIALAPGATKDQVEAARKEINANQAGVKNRGKAMVITSSTTTVPQITPKDAELLELLGYTAKQFARAADIPESIFELNSANLSSASMGMRQYMELGILPRVNADADINTERLLPFFDLDPDEYCFAYVNVVPEDLKEKAEVGALYIRDWGMPPNEAAKRLGMEPFEGGDNPREAQSPNAFGGFGNPSFGKPKEPSKAITSKRQEVAADGLENFPENIDAAADRIARQLDDLFTIALVTGDISKDGVTMSPKLVEQLAEVLRLGITEMLEAGGRYGLDRIGADPFTFDVNSDLAVAAIEGRVRALVTTVPQSFKERVAEVVARGIRDGQSVADIAATLREASPNLTQYQATRIARNETVTAFNAGQYEAWSRSGVPFKAWNIAGDACPICVAMHDTYAENPIPMGEPFILPDGTEVLFPGGEVHVFCRCDFVPVFADAQGNPIKSFTRPHHIHKGGCQCN